MRRGVGGSGHCGVRGGGSGGWGGGGCGGEGGGGSGRICCDTQMVGLFVQISERRFSFKPVTVNALCNMCGNCLHFLFIGEELLKRMKANKHPHHPV